MALDPRIPLGVQPIQSQQPNMLGQVAQIMGIRAAQQDIQGNEELRAAYAQGGDLNDPEFRRRVMAANPKLGSQLIKTNAETSKLQNEAIAKRIDLSREMLTNINTPEDYIAWHEANHKDPVLGGYLGQRGVTAEQSRAKIMAELSKPGGLEKLKRESALGATALQKELMQTERTFGAAQISAGPGYQRNALEREKWQYDIDNPKMTPLAGEKVDATGNKVPAYFGYDPRTNSMVEVSMPTVSVGSISTVGAGTPVNSLAPQAPSVNAFTAPAAGAPTSPVMRPPVAGMPSAAAPNAAIPSAGSPASVSGGTTFRPKLSPEAAKQEQIEKDRVRGKTEVTEVIGNLASKYQTLASTGGVTSTKKGVLENIGSYLANTAAGQEVGKMTATQEQSLRNEIKAQSPILLQGIKKATGMTAKEMDSNADVKRWLEAMGNPTFDIQSTIGILNSLNKQFGTGGELPVAPSAVPAANKPSGGFKYIGPVKE